VSRRVYDSGEKLEKVNNSLLTNWKKENGGCKEILPFSPKNFTKKPLDYGIGGGKCRK
jgi:hypothetical protein